MARVYPDACIVIYLIQGPQEFSATILQALRPQEGEPSAVFASDLTRLPFSRTLCHELGHRIAIR